MKPQGQSSKPAGRSKYLVPAAVLCAVVALAGVAWWYFRFQSPSSEKKQTFAAAGYVDGAVCASCHAEIAATYSKTGMGRAFNVPSPQNVIEDYGRANTVTQASTGMKYTMMQRDGKFFQRRSTIGFDGQETNVLEEQVDYIVGSGTHGRAYLHRNPQGKLIELPISWYAEKGGYWNMTTGFDHPGHTDMHGTIAPECMFCHNGYPEIDSDALRDAEPRFPAKLPMGIDCQRCHGPGREHVAAAQAKKPAELIRSSIVNPATLSRDRQLEVCLECHLETSNLHRPNAIVNYDRKMYSFKPGEALSEYVTYFEKPKDPKTDEFEIAHAGYQLRRSQCFIQSKMTCLTCHDPHDVPHGPQAAKYYIAACERCHQGVKHTVAMPTGSDCLSCHMPKRRSEGSVHIVLTDHYIQRERPLRDLLAPLTEMRVAEDLTPVDIFYTTPAKEATAKAALYLAVARVNDGDGVQGVTQLQQVLDREQPHHPEPYLAIGRSYERLGKHAEAIRAFDQALAIQPGFRPALRELAVSLFSAGDDTRALDVLQKATAQYPDDDLLLTNLGNAYLRKNQNAESVEALNRAVAVNPGRAETYNLLGLAAMRRDDKAEAERHFREALRLQPDLAEANNNLANLLTGQHNFDEAAFLYRQALKGTPDYYQAHYGLGLLYVLKGDNTEGLKELREAGRLAPGAVQVHSDLADALASQSQFTEAITEYRKVLQIDSTRPDAHLGLAMVLLRQNQPQEAVQHLQVAANSPNPEVSGQARGILQQIMR